MISCIYCHRIHKNLKGFSQHLTTKHKDAPFFCMKCGASLSNETWWPSSRGKHRLCNACIRKLNKEHNDAYNKRRWRKNKLAVIDGYGGKCSCCGESHPEFLSIDHINGNGKEHRKLVGTRLYAILIREGFPKDNYRLLCMNCNFAIGHFGYCPHQKDGS